MRELFFSVRSSYTRNKTFLFEERLKSAAPVAESADEKRRRLSAEGRRKEFRTAGGKLHALEEGALFGAFSVWAISRGYVIGIGTNIPDLLIFGVF